MSKSIGLLGGLALGVAVVAPSFVAAQSSGTALLTVYVQVVNPSSSSTYYVTPRNPGDFSVIVAGQSVSPSSFFGSNNGTQVSLGNGSYSVALTGNQYGFTPSYSAGCNGTLAAGESGLCVITMNPQYNSSYPNVYPYPYPYINQPSLTCAPANQTVGLNQNVNFTAQGGIGGTYNWEVPGRNFPNVGPVLTVAFDNSGSQLVTVTNGAQSATCQVTVTNTYYPTPASSNLYPGNTYPYGYNYNTSYPNYTNYNYGATTYPNTIYPYGYGCNSCGYATPTVTSSYYPRLPNTGVEPLTVAQLALALTLLAGVALIAQPYVRKAFSVAVR